MNVISREKSAVVRFASELVVGGVYQVNGTTLRPDKDKYGKFIKSDGCITYTRKPIPPQLVVVLAPPTGQDVKVHFYCDDGAGGIEHDTTMTLSDVNVPEGSAHDRYLERIPDATVMKGMRALAQQNKKQNYMEMSMDRQTWAKGHWE